MREKAMQIGVDSERAVDNRRVFVVDSDEITSAALQFMLHDEIETHELSSLDAAYAKAKDWKPDVLLLGAGIVKDQGLSVLQEIRSAIADLKIILVADSATDPFVKDCLMNGVNSVLTRPLTIEKARQKVDTQLGRKVKLSIPVQVL
jgi:PleD family two-component response regulator